MSESFDPRRRWLGAITLVLCIGILWALLMPAMRGTSRDPARRTQCKSNLKNLALATINFETVKKQFPGYQSVFGKRDDESAKIGSWVVALLPMLEQQALRDEWDDPTTQESWLAAVRNKDEEMLKVFYPEMNIFNCPSDILEKSKFGATSYAVNAGFHLLPNDPALGFDVYVNAADAAAQSAVSQRAANGVFANRAGPSVIDPQTGKLTSVFGYHSNRISSADVKDGLSSTILFAENCNSLSWQDFSIVDDTSRCKQGIVWLYAGTSASDGRPKPIAVTSDMRINHGNTKSKGGPVRARPSGFHSGIIVLAFADGSTRSISGDIDYHVYQSLMAPQDSASDIPNQSYVLKEMDYEL